MWGGAITQKLVVEPNADAATRSRPTEEAIARDKVALVLERLGRTRDAEEQLSRAARVSGVRDPAKLRDLAVKTISIAAEHR